MRVLLVKIKLVSGNRRCGVVVITAAQLHSTKSELRFKSCSRRVGDSRWWVSLTMVTAGNKAKRFLSVNHTTKTLHHHHLHHQTNHQTQFQFKSFVFNPLSANITKWSNTLKQFVGNLSTNCLSVFGHFVIFAFKGLHLTVWNHCFRACNRRSRVWVGL